jgi:broad specificity phosphatase PhoE
MDFLKNMDIIFIRHGQAAHNVDRRAFKKYSDATMPLTEKGEEQALITAKFLNEYLPNIGFDKYSLYCSPYIRAVQTRDIILSKLDNQPKNNKINMNLRECYAGAIEGIPLSELPNQFPEYTMQRKRDKENKSSFFTCFPMGDSPADAAARCMMFLQHAKAEYEDNGINKFVVVFHGMALRALLTELLHSDDFSHYNFIEGPRNGSVYRIKNGIAVNEFENPKLEACVFIPK